MEKFYREMCLRHHGRIHTATIDNWSGHGEQRTYRIDTRPDLVLMFDCERDDDDFYWEFGEIDRSGRLRTCFPYSFETWHDAMKAMAEGDDLFWK